MKYYVLAENPFPRRFGDGYYTGDTYVYQGEIYAVCNKDLKKAKRYTSKKRAERAAAALFYKICNYIFEVEEIEEGAK